MVSLTTIPGRQDLLKRALASIRRQTLRPDAVYLWLPDDKFGVDLDGLQFDEVEVRRTPELGPATKILPTLSVERDPETLIVPLDDDVEYPARLLEKLVAASTLLPDHAIGFTGWCIDADAHPATVTHFNEAVPASGMVQSVHVLEGYRGVLYRRQFFEDDILDHLHGLDAFRLHDDILLSGYLAERGIPRASIWFGGGPPREQGRWGLLGDDLGLHTGAGWFDLGIQCVDYWRRRSRGVFGSIDAPSLDERLQFGAEVWRHPGFRQHVPVPERLGSQCPDRLTDGAWPWRDESFREIIIGESVFAGSSAGAEVLREGVRVLLGGGILKARVPLDRLLSVLDATDGSLCWTRSGVSAACSLEGSGLRAPEGGSLRCCVEREGDTALVTLVKSRPE